jgi:choline/glycine/proline betaine transport protein
MSATGLEALQTATIASAFPFRIILLISLYGLFKALRVDYGKKEIRINSINNVQTSAASGGWQKRLRSLVLYPRRDHVIRFIEEVVQPAFEEVAAELSKQGIQTTISKKSDDDILFEVEHGKNDNFMYRIKARHYLKPNFSSIEASDIDPDYQKYFRAEVHLDNGAQGYDIMGYSKESLSNDIVDQYTNHLQFIHNFQLEHDVKSILKETNNGNDANGNSETTEEPSKA